MHLQKQENQLLFTFTFYLLLLAPKCNLTFHIHTRQPCGAEARFTSQAEKCYTTNKEQESPCQPMLRNECCDEKLLAGYNTNPMG